jgi:hypothetical protein
MLAMQKPIAEIESANPMIEVARVCRLKTFMVV